MTFLQEWNRKQVLLEELTPRDISSSTKGNPFVGDCPEQTMSNVCGVLRVLEQTVTHEPEMGPAQHETHGWYLLFSGPAKALQVHVEHMAHEPKGQRPTDGDSAAHYPPRSRSSPSACATHKDLGGAFGLTRDISKKQDVSRPGG